MHMYSYVLYVTFLGTGPSEDVLAPICEPDTVGDGTGMLCILDMLRACGDPCLTS